MPEFKEKPGPGKRGKARSPGAALPRQAARQMKEKTIRERKQPTEETEPRNGYAEERVEQAGRWAVEELAGTAVPTRRARKPGDPKKEEAPTDQEAGPDAPADAARTEEQPPRANQPKERKAVEQRKREGGQAGSSAAVAQCLISWSITTRTAAPSRENKPENIQHLIRKNQRCLNV